MVNRRFSMTMMIETASSKTANQFIFLTPLDMSHIKTQTNIRIYQMKDPDRSQSILPFKPCVNNGDKDEDK